MKKKYTNSDIKFLFKETCCNNVIEDIISGESDIGFIVFLDNQKSVFEKIFTIKELNFGYMDMKGDVCALVSKKHPFSERISISIDELKNYNLVVFGDESIHQINYIAEYELLGINVLENAIEVFDHHSLNKILKNTDYISLGINAKAKDKEILSIPIEGLDTKFKLVWISKENPSFENIKSELIEIVKSHF